MAEVISIGSEGVKLMIGFTQAVWLAGLAIATCRPVPAEPPSPDFLFAAFADNQERTRSGIVRAAGTVSSKSTEYGPVSGPTAIFCAFDVDAKMVRFDRSEPMPVRRLDQTPSGYIAGQPMIAGGKYAATPTRGIVWSLQHPGHVRFYPIGYPSRTTAKAILPFDPRILGLANFTTVKHQCDADSTITDFRTRLARCPVTSSEPRPGLYRLRWVERRGGLEIDFDQAVGFMPVRYADFTRPAGGGQGVPYDSAVTTWQARGGVYVPVTARFQDGPDGAPDLSRYDLKLTWEVVNGPVDESLTTARGMDLPSGTLITDNTQDGRSIPLGKVGDLTPDPKLRYVETHRVAAPLPAEAAPALRRWPWIIAGVAGLLMLGAGVRLVIRRRRR